MKTALACGIALLAAAATAVAQEGNTGRTQDGTEDGTQGVPRNLQQVTWVDHEGTVRDAYSPNEARFHVIGEGGVASADYFRGAFDGVREKIDHASFRGSATLVFEPWEEEKGWRGSLGLVLGMQGAAANVVTPTGDAGANFGLGDLEHWYEADFYAGVTLRVLDDVIVGGTYTAYTSPNGASAKREEVAVEAVFEGEGALGDLNFRAKAAVPLDDGDGYYLEAGIAPTLRFLDVLPIPFELQADAAVGYGSKDYYRDDTQRSGYVRLGLGTSIGLFAPSEEIGAWFFDARADYYLRDDDLRDLSPVDDERDTAVLIASLGIRFVF